MTPLDHVEWMVRELFSYAKWPFMLYALYALPKSLLSHNFKDAVADKISYMKTVACAAVLAGFLGYLTYETCVPRKAGYEDATHTENEDSLGGDVVHEQVWVGARKGEVDPIERGLAVGIIALVPMLLAISTARKLAVAEFSTSMS